MKAKLLKKVRKRFKYYFKNNQIVILDTKFKRDYVINTIKDAANILGYEDPSGKIQVSPEEYKMRSALIFMIRPFGFIWENKRYSYHLRQYNSKNKK